jgi:serine/threonine protein phosphatase 1
MLDALLGQILDQPLAAEDTVVFLGDYVDRGEDSRGVIDTLLRWQDRHPNTIFLRGNHEQLMLDAYSGTSESAATSDPGLRTQLTLAWLQNGGVETLLSYEAPGFGEWCETIDYRFLRIPADPLTAFKSAFPAWLESVPPSHWQFLRETQMEYVTAHYHFVHAGLLPPGKTWESEGWTIDPRLWVREPFLSSRADFDGRLVVFGHTPQRSGRPLVQRNKIGLDTGAVFGGPLTAGLFTAPEERPRFLQTPSMRHDARSQAASARSEHASPRASSAKSSKT